MTKHKAVSPPARTAALIALILVSSTTRAARAEPGYASPYPAPDPSAEAEELPYQAGQPIPPGYEKVTRHRTGLAGLGAFFFLVAYTPSLAAGVNALGRHSSPNNSDFDPGPVSALMIPVVGPLITSSGASNYQPAGYSQLLVVDSLVQAVGLGLVIAGLATERPVLVRKSITVYTATPYLSSGAAGLAVAGAF
jgi:hypothetical protein